MTILSFSISKKKHNTLSELLFKKIHSGTIFQMENRWVVTNIPYLIIKFQIHITIEYCDTINSINLIPVLPRNYVVLTLKMEGKLSM